MRKTLTLLTLVTLLFVASSSAPASETGVTSPADLLETLTRALAESDYPTYVDCLHAGARAVPEYGSEEAMRFWAHEFDRLRARGFDGHFELVVVTTDEPRLPAGAVLAHPLIDGEAIPDTIVLIEEAGSWRILRLFS